MKSRKSKRLMGLKYIRMVLNKLFMRVVECGSLSGIEFNVNLLFDCKIDLRLLGITFSNNDGKVISNGVV